MNQNRFSPRISRGDYGNTSPKLLLNVLEQLRRDVKFTCTPDEAALAAEQRWDVLLKLPDVATPPARRWELEIPSHTDVALRLQEVLSQREAISKLPIKSRPAHGPSRLDEVLLTIANDPIHPGRSLSTLDLVMRDRRDLEVRLVTFPIIQDRRTESYLDFMRPSPLHATTLGEMADAYAFGLPFKLLTLANGMTAWRNNEVTRLFVDVAATPWLRRPQVQPPRNEEEMTNLIYEQAVQLCRSGYIAAGSALLECWNELAQQAEWKGRTEVKEERRKKRFQRYVKRTEKAGQPVLEEWAWYNMETSARYGRSVARKIMRGEEVDPRIRALLEEDVPF